MQDLQPYKLPDPFDCLYCGAKLFLHETSAICCSNGTITLPRPSSPNELVELFMDQSQSGQHFRHHIRAYNHIFAFTSMGVTIDENFASARNGVFTYRAQGTIYHRIGSILPIEGRRPRYLQLYIYDTDHEIENRRAENEGLRDDVISTIKNILDTHNPFVGAFRQLGQRDDTQNCRLIIKELRTNRRNHELPTSSQVAAILIGYNDPEGLQERDIIVQTQTGHIS